MGAALGMLIAGLALFGPDPVSAQPTDSASTNATDARIVGDALRTRFVADFGKVVPISVFTLADPYRVVVDLPDIHFLLPPDTGHEGRGLVTAFRYGQISAGRSRIVLDLQKPALIDKAFFLPAAPGEPARLVVDVVPTTREVFLEASRKYRDADPAPKTKTEPPAAKPADGKRRIVVDPGHGGIDAGARGAGGALEKDIVLAFATILAKALTATGRYEVQVTRTGDTFLSLKERVEFGRRHSADLFVSIHADSFRRDRSVRGAAVYTLSEKASDEMAAVIAEQENKSDIIAGADRASVDDDGVVDILLDLTRRETKNFSIVFARDVVTEMKGEVRLSRSPHQQAGFLVLKAPDMPSALIELGFLSNREDEKLLQEPDWQEKTAAAIVRAINAYFSSVMARKAGP